MDRISNVDRLVVVLRQRLMERTRLQAGASKERRKLDQERTPTGLEQVQALAGIEAVDDQQLQRALIQSILTDHFGPTLLNEAKFQQVVDRVTDTLKRDPQLAGLFTQVVGELRKSAR